MSCVLGGVRVRGYMIDCQSDPGKRTNLFYSPKIMYLAGCAGRGPNWVCVVVRHEEEGGPVLGRGSVGAGRGGRGRSTSESKAVISSSA